VTYVTVLTRKGGVGMNKVTSLSEDMFQSGSPGKRRIANHLMCHVLIDVHYVPTVVCLWVLVYLCFRVEMW